MFHSLSDVNYKFTYMPQLHYVHFYYSEYVHMTAVCIKDGVLVIEKIIIEKILVMMITTVKTMMETMMISLTS